MKIIITIFFIMLGVSSPSNAMQQFRLDNGNYVYGYYLNDIPKEIQKDNCDKYVFADEKFTPLSDGRYISEDNNIIIVQNSCLFTNTGEAKLFNGDIIEFYEGGTMNADGNLVFIKINNGYKRIYNEEMQLSNGQKFSVENGYIPAAFFDGTNIIYEDRN